MDDKQRLAVDELLAEHSRWHARRNERLRKAYDLAERLRNPGGRSFAELEAVMDELKRIIDPNSPESLGAGDHRFAPSGSEWPHSMSPSSRPRIEDGKFDEDDDDDDLDRPTLPTSRQ